MLYPWYLKELRALTRLAVPLIVARTGHNVLYTVDTIVAGHISPAAVAAIGLAGAAYIVVYLGAFGLLLGLDPLVSNAVGAGDQTLARAGLRVARRIALLAAVPTALAVACVPVALGALAQPAEAVALVGQYTPLLALAVFPQLQFHVDSTFMTAQGHTRHFVAIVALANLTNLVLNLWLVDGGLGVPALGLTGIGLATLGCSITELLAIRWFMRRGGPFGDLAHDLPAAVDLDVGGQIMRTGRPVGIQYALEASGFTVVTLLVGLKGTVAVAGHHVAMNFAAIAFTVAMGIGSAAGVRVGHARGRRDREALRRSGMVGFLVGMASGVLFGVVAALARFPIARLYTSDPATLEMAASFLLVAAVWQIADSTQAAGFGILRGIDDTRVPSMFNVIAYWGFGLPLGALGAFVLGDDPRALWWGLVLALFLVATALVVRFERRTRTDACLAPLHTGEVGAAPGAESA